MTTLAALGLIVAIFCGLLGFGALLVERVIPWWEDRRARSKVVDLQRWKLAQSRSDDWLREGYGSPRWW